MPTNNNPSVGIIGRGNFSKLLEKLLQPYASDIKLIGRDSSPEERISVFSSDIVVLGVTLDAYQVVLKELKEHIKPEALLVDVCSVKVKPLKLIKAELPGHSNLLITHPLFGPQSAKNGTKDLRLILCEQHGEVAKSLLAFCQDELELNIIEMTPEEHDQAMAYTHALTFFVSQALHPFNLEEQGITTPSFQELVDLSNISKNETKQLLNSIQKDNPFARDVRDQFAIHVQNLAKELDT